MRFWLMVGNTIRIAPLALVMLCSGWGSFAFGDGSIRLGLKEDSYLGGAQNQFQEQNYTILSTQLTLEKSSESLSYKIDPLFQGALEAQDELYFGVPEAYISSRTLAPGFKLTVGRELRTWSRLDEEFNLGLWQPQLRWNYLDPIQQGLIGFFFDWSIDSRTQVTFFASPINIPDQGPEFKINNGQFQSSNRWFVQPQSRVQLFSGTPYASDAPLYFELERPAEEKIINHASFALGLRRDWSSRWWSTLNYAYKPRNQIHIGLECTTCANIGGGSPVEVTAKIHPTIVRHHVTTVESGFKRQDDRGWISASYEVPEDSGFPDEYAEAPVESSLVVGAAYSHFIGEWIQVPSWLGMSYLRLWSFKRAKKASVIANDEVESSLDRYPYQEVLATDWTVRLFETSWGTANFKNRYTFSIPESGGWFSSLIEWNYQELSVNVGADILGAEVDPQSNRSGLFSRYRSNDRVFGGLSYVF